MVSLSDNNMRVVFMVCISNQFVIIFVIVVHANKIILKLLIEECLMRTFSPSFYFLILNMKDSNWKIFLKKGKFNQNKYKKVT